MPRKTLFIVVAMLIGFEVALGDYNLTLPQANDLQMVNNSVNLVTKWSSLSNGYCIATFKPSKRVTVTEANGQIKVIQDSEGHYSDAEAQYHFSLHHIHRHIGVFWSPYLDADGSQLVLILAPASKIKGTLDYPFDIEYIYNGWIELISFYLKSDQRKQTSEILKQTTFTDANILALLLNFQQDPREVTFGDKDKLFAAVSATKGYSRSILVCGLFNLLGNDDRLALISKMLTLKNLSDSDLYLETLGILASGSFQSLEPTEQSILISPIKSYCKTDSTNYSKVLNLLTACGQ